MAPLPRGDHRFTEAAESSYIPVYIANLKHFIPSP